MIRTTVSPRNIVAMLALLATSTAACTTSQSTDGSVESGATEAVGFVDLGESSSIDEDDSESATEHATEQRPAEPEVEAGVVVDETGESAEPPALPVGFAIDGDAEQTTRADGATVTTGDVVVTTGAGAVVLEQAEIIESADGDVVTVAAVPLPTTGPLANAAPTALPKGKVGTATGAQLASTVPHLNSDTTYTYLLFRGSLDLETGVDGGASDLLDHISIFGQEPGIVVIDPDDYFYLGGTCPGGGTSDKERSKAVNSNGAKRAEVSDFDPVVLTLEPSDVAVPCGFGISNWGKIPAVPDLSSESAPMTEMNAHIVVHGSEVIAPGLALDGTFFVQLLEPGFRVIANGTLLASLSVISGKLGVDLPLGDATVDMGVSSDGLQVRFVAQTPDLDELLLPVVVDFVGAEGGIRTEGALDFAIASDGAPSISAESYLQIAGRLNLHTGGLAGVAGVELSTVSVDGLMRLDPTGYRIAGAVDGSFIPGIDIDAGASVDAYIAFADLADSSIRIDGSAGIGAIQLSGDAGVQLDRNGVEAWGLASLPFGDIEVRGAVTAEGVFLTGAARAVVPLGPIADAASAIRGELDKAKAEVATIDDEIDRIRADINAGRDANQAGLRQAQADVAAERAKLDAILDTMAYNRSEIRRMQQLQEDSWDPFYDFDLSLRIGALEVANVAQDGYRVIAQGALDIAIGALQVIEAGLEIIPVDADPRIVALFIAREAAMLVLDGASAVLSIVPDEVRANLEITVGTQGFAGEAGIETCTDGSCSTVVSGSVQSSPAQLCFVLLDQNICVGLPELALI